MHNSVVPFAIFITEVMFSNLFVIVQMYQNLLLILQLGKCLTCVGFPSPSEERPREREGVLGEVGGTCWVSAAVRFVLWFLIPLKVLF